MGWLSKIVGLSSPSRTALRVGSGKKATDTGPLTFKNSVDEGNVMGINPKKPAADTSAAALEAERQARISKNVGDINSAFGNRQGQYDAYLAAVRKNLGSQLTKQQGVASRNLKFSLARGGLTGGSAAVDKGADLQDEFRKGALDVESKAQSGAAGLQQKDEASRLSLISLAQAGGDIGDAAGQTASMLQANTQGALNESGTQTLGDVFGSTAQTYKTMQEAANLRRGLRDSDIYAKNYRGTTGGLG